MRSIDAMRLRECLLPLVLVAACSRAHAPRQVTAVDPATKRPTVSGEVVGGPVGDGAVAWLGIPYAAPPVGPRRWRAPAPPVAWTGVREATRYGAACPQYASSFGGVDGAPGSIVGNEDCLTLNVFAPANATASSRLPVMVWIHGGGNTIGAASFYDGARLAATEQVVVVTVQYRLGPLGWFRNPVLAADQTPAERSGDFALLDLIQALQWVRDDVAAFGGDPGVVTIFGESAGGQNVYLLLTAPAARGLFHRAVVESGGLWASTIAAGENAADATDPGDAQSSEEIIRRMLSEGRTEDRAQQASRRAAMGDAEIAAALRALPATELIGLYTPLPSGMIDMPRVFRDGTVLPAGELLTQLGSRDGWNAVPVLVGANRDEVKIFMFTDPRYITKKLWILPRFVDEPFYLAAAEYRSRWWKATGVDEPAEAMTTSGGPGVWAYQFDWDEEPTVLGADLAKMLGAAHGLEIPFVFGHFDLGRAANAIFTDANLPGREALSKPMMHAWATFARTGVPDPAWPRWDAAAPARIVLDTPEGGGIRPAAGRETREGVLAALAADPRLAEPVKRCRVLHDMAEWRRGFGRADYDARPDCTAFPYDGYPWAG